MDNDKVKADQDEKSEPTQQEEACSDIEESRNNLISQSDRRPASGRKPLFGS